MLLYIVFSLRGQAVYPECEPRCGAILAQGSVFSCSILEIRALDSMDDGMRSGSHAQSPGLFAIAPLGIVWTATNQTRESGAVMLPAWQLSWKKRCDLVGCIFFT